MSFLQHIISDLFLIFFFGINLPNRVAWNHPINEAATKTLPFSVILFELPSEHCACGHESIGFAEPMSPLRFMFAHSYLLIILCTDSLATVFRLRPPTIQRLRSSQCPLHWAGCSEEWTTSACSMTDVVTGDSRKILLIGTGPITVLQGTRSYFFSEPRLATLPLCTEAEIHHLCSCVWSDFLMYHVAASKDFQDHHVF